MIPVVFSAVQPSGELTIGNYIGALKHWVRIQDKFSCIYSIADQHAITTQQDPQLLYRNTLDTLALYIACGIDPQKSIIFVQSHVKEHAQLTWILNCHTYLGDMRRMTQFKKNITYHSSSSTNFGLFSYPTLMAADILLYQTDYVPVGEDQKQHLEFTRNIARRCNLVYDAPFKLPKPFIPKYGGRIMSLLNPKIKMSKSDKNKKNIITLLETPDLLIKKIKRAVTDSSSPPNIYYDTHQKAGISNLLNIIAGLSDKNIQYLESYYVGKNYSALKKDVIEVVMTFMISLQKRYRFYRKDETFLKKIMVEGAEKARLKAAVTLRKLHNSIGFFPCE